MQGYAQSNHDVLHWKAVSQLTERRNFEFITLPGEIMSIALRPRTQIKSEQFALKLHWVEDKNKPFSQHLMTNNRSCFRENTHIKYDRKCPNFSHALGGNMERIYLFSFPRKNLPIVNPFYLKERDLTVRTKVIFEHSRVSWVQASKVCRDAGGCLPSFMRRNDMEELIAFFKLTHELPPTEAVYIGLRYHRRRNVSLNTLHHSLSNRMPLASKTSKQFGYSLPWVFILE